MTFIGMGVWGVVLLIAGAIVISIAVQSIGTPHRYEWLVSGLGAFVGGFVASELLHQFWSFGPETDGLLIVPAVVGGIVLGVAASYVTRGFTELLPSATA